MASSERSTAWDMLGTVLLFNFLAFGLLALRTTPLDRQALYLAAFIAAVYSVTYVIVRVFFKKFDAHLMLLVFLLSNIGFIMLYRLDAQSAVRQVRWFIIGIAVFFIIVAFMRYARGLDKYFYIYAAVSVILLILPMAVGIVRGGAKNWLDIGGHTVQPSEFVKVLFVMAAASILKEKKNLKELWPLMAFVAICMLVLVLENDLGTMAIYFAVFVMMLYIATSNLLYVFGSLLVAAGAGYIAYLVLGHVKVRIEAWLNPWADATGKGYQIAQSLIAIGSGGWLGAGLGLGQPNVIPAAKTDFIFAAIAEEFGVLVAVAIVAIYFIIIYRGMVIGLKAADPFKALVVVGAVAALGFQTFVIIGGVIKLIPLTGVTLPFVSYGGSSMVASFIVIGLIQSASIEPEPSEFTAEAGEERYDGSY